MSQAGRQNNGGPVPAGAVLKVETDDHAQASPDIAGIVYYIPRPATVLRESNIETSGDTVNTFFAAVTDSIYLPATAGPDVPGSSGIIGIERHKILHAFGGFANQNLFVGFDAGNLLPTLTGDDNTIIGANSGVSLENGTSNVSLGKDSLFHTTSSIGCCAIGTNSLANNVSGFNNIALGFGAGINNSPDADNNINIGNDGQGGVVDRIAIGTVGTHQECFIHGIRAVALDPLNTPQTVLIDQFGQLGSTALVPNGIQFFNVPDPVPGPHPVNPDGIDGHISFQDGPNILIDTPVASTVRVSVTPNITLQPTNAAGTQGVYLYNASRFMHIGSSGLGTFLGVNSGTYTQTGPLNTCLGHTSGGSLTTGQENTTIGGQSGQNITSGSRNTLCGVGTANLATTADTVTALGYRGGYYASNNQSNNIWIGNWGVAGVNNRITIGTNISHAPEQQVHRSCYIHGIWTQPVAAAYQQVVIDGTGKLGSLPIVPAGGVLYRDKFGVDATANLNVITFSGDANVNSVASAHAITYSLANSITIANNITATNGFIRANTGFIRAGDYVKADTYIETGTYAKIGTYVEAGTNIVALHGDITSSTGNVIANQTLVAQTGGANITGPITFGSYPTGVLLLNNTVGAHSLNSFNGANGQVLRAGGPGVLPLWNTLNPGPGITIDTTNVNQITISAPGSSTVRPAFSGQLIVPGTIPAGGNYIFSNLATDFNNTTFDQNTCTFTAPVTGLYHFTVAPSLFSQNIVSPLLMEIAFYIVLNGGDYHFALLDTSTYRPVNSHITLIWSIDMPVNAGSTVRFKLHDSTHLPTYPITVVIDRSRLSGFLVST